MSGFLDMVWPKLPNTERPNLIDIIPSVVVDPRTSPAVVVDPRTSPDVVVDPRTLRPARRVFVGTSPAAGSLRVSVFGRSLETGVDTDESSSGEAVLDPYGPIAEPAAEASQTAAEASPAAEATQTAAETAVEFDSLSELDDEQYANIVADLFSSDEMLDIHKSAKSEQAVPPAAVLASSQAVPPAAVLASSPSVLQLKVKAKNATGSTSWPSSTAAVGPAAAESASSHSSLESVRQAVSLANSSPPHPMSRIPRNPMAVMPPVPPMPRVPMPRVPMPPPPPPAAGSRRGATGKGRGVPTHINTGFLNVVAQLYELRIPPT
jgi:hypothetical protein